MKLNHCYLFCHLRKHKYFCVYTCLSQVGDRTMFCRFGLFPGATDQGHDWGAKKYSDLAEGHDGVESTAIHPKPTASSRIFLDIVPSNCNRPRHTSACMLMEYTSTAGTDTVDFRNRHANGLVRSLTQTLADSSLCTSPPRLFHDHTRSARDMLCFPGPPSREDMPLDMVSIVRIQLL